MASTAILRRHGRDVPEKCVHVHQGFAATGRFVFPFSFVRT